MILSRSLYTHVGMYVCMTIYRCIYHLYLYMFIYKYKYLAGIIYDYVSPVGKIIGSHFSPYFLRLLHHTSVAFIRKITKIFNKKEN